jgi:hypothetical protein
MDCVFRTAQVVLVTTLMALSNSPMSFGIEAIQERLKQFYVENGVLDDNCRDNLLLHEACPDAHACWVDKTLTAQWNRIQCPYIGSKYHLGRILFVGLNLREYGGWHSLLDLFEGEHGVKKSLMNKRRRMNFNNHNYRGTLVYHRLSVYAHILLHPESDPYSVALTAELADTCDFVAFLEAIKCAPDDGEMCTPIGDMRSRCPSRFLFNEIAILAPQRVVFFDKGAFNLFTNPNNAAVVHSAGGKVSRVKITFRNHNMEVFRIVHPAARGGSSVEIGRALKSLLPNCRDGIDIQPYVT